MGVAGRVAKAFIHSPLSPLLFIAMLFMGLMGLILTPRQEDPQISVPMVDIFIEYPGASSEQVAAMAIEPLERIMSEIPGVKHVYSTSQRGKGMVIVRFEVGENLGPSIVKVHDKIQSNLDKIPPGVSMPLVKPKGIDDVSVVNLTLWSTDVDDSALRTLALDVLQRLKEIPDTGPGEVVGGRAEQVRVEVQPERLSGFGIGLDQVANTIRTANAEKSTGHVESGGAHLSVKSGAFLKNADDIRNLVVGTHLGVPVYVRDVARVFQGPEDTRKLVSYSTGPAYEQATGVDLRASSAPAVTISVAKKEGANGVTVAEAILNKVETLKNTLIPANVHVETTRNYGETANDKVNELILKLFVATGAVFFLVLGAFRAARPAMVVLLVIPVVILITVFSAWLMGYTIDRVSLFALIFSIGILVDDAIVVVENIYRRWLEKGQTDADTAVDAVREVGNPTILATFTVIAALLPMGFVTGMMGPYMLPIPVLGSVAMLFSLMAAFVFTPWLALRLKPSMKYLRRAEAREHSGGERLERMFRRILVPLIESPLKGRLFRIGIWTAFMASCAMFYTTAVTVKMLPYDNKPEFGVVIDMPEGTALPVTANLAQELTQQILKIPEVTAAQTYAGAAKPFDFNGMVRHYYLRGEPWQADINVQLLHKTQRERSSHEIAKSARAALTKIAHREGARITVVEMPPGPPVLQSVVAEIYGPDDWTRRQVTTKMTEFFEKAESIADADNYMQQPFQYWRFEVDTEKAVRRGISVDTVNRNLDMALGGYKLGDIKRGSVLEPTYIVMQVPLQVRAQITRLTDLPIMSDSGQTVPLGELGQFVQVPEDPLVYHKDLRPLEYVVGDAVGRLAAPIYAMFEVEDELKHYTTPDGVVMSGDYLGSPPDNGKSAFEWGGEWTVTYETFRDMGLAFGAALVLIYILVVWEFGNFRVPLIIMAPIPLTLLGIIPGHWLLHAEFTATSMIGWIALAGIIVRNSILLVDFSIHEIKRGTSLQDAVVLACKTRTRPIMITALALVCGSFVILTDPIFQGMAISLAFGVMVSTLLTLLVIPLGCLRAGKALFPSVAAQEAAAGEAVPVGGGPAVAPAGTGGSLGWVLWGKLVGVLTMVFYLVRAILILAWQAFRGVLKLLGVGRAKPPPHKPASSSRGGGSGGSKPPPGSGGGAAVLATGGGQLTVEPRPAAKAAAVDAVVAQRDVATVEEAEAIESRRAAEAQAAEQARRQAEREEAEETRRAAQAKAAEEARLKAEREAAAASRRAAEAKAAEQARQEAEREFAEESHRTAETTAAESTSLRVERDAAQQARRASEATNAVAGAEAHPAEKSKPAKEQDLGASSQQSGNVRDGASSRAEDKTYPGGLAGRASSSRKTTPAAPRSAKTSAAPAATAQGATQAGEAAVGPRPAVDRSEDRRGGRRGIRLKSNLSKEPDGL